VSALAEDAQPVTVLVRHVVAPEHVEQFRAWVSGISGASSEFEGYMGTEVIRPVSDGDGGEFVVIFRFNSYPNLERWLGSPERERWLARGRDFASPDAELEQHSLEFWFAPSKSSSIPPRYKMAIVTFLVIWPLVHFLPPLVGRAIGPGTLGAEVVGVAAIVGLMSYVVMPLVSWLLRPLLVPRR
jgi:hypothetical protein